MNNLIARVIDVTASYQPLCANKVIGTVTLSAPPANGDVVYLLGDTGQDIPLVAGEWHTFKNVNLNEIKVKGTAPDLVTVIGGTW